MTVRSGLALTLLLLFHFQPQGFAALVSSPSLYIQIGFFSSQFDHAFGPPA
jgi:hypothetical protein